LDDRPGRLHCGSGPPAERQQLDDRPQRLAPPPRSLKKCRRFVPISCLAAT
jgi:hypothetical protein